MYLWDANILRAFGQGHATLRSYLLRVPWSEIALPTVVVAEVNPAQKLRMLVDHAGDSTSVRPSFAALLRRLARSRSRARCS
jgi:hypothetical protein